MLFEQALQNKPDALALADFYQNRSWRQLYRQILLLRDIFQNHYHLQPDQHIALLIGNRLEFFEAMLAGIVSGLWVTPVNTHLSEAEIRYIISDSNASLLLYDDAHQYITESELPCKAVNIQTLSQQLLQQAETADELCLPDDSLAGGTMLYTSGTTGYPKGVRRNKPVLLQEALEKMAAGARSLGLSGAGPHLVTGPLYHAAPMLFALYDMLNGASVIILRKWDIQEFLIALQNYQVQTTHLVPTMFVRLLHFHEKNPIDSNVFSSLRLVLHGAAPIAKSVKQQMIAWWGPILLEYWGASEAGTTTLVNSQDWLAHPGTVGKPLPHFQVYVGDEAGNPIAAREGLLFCKHQFLAQVFEYHNAAEKTRKAHPKPYTFCIGDIGYLDAEGFVYLSDRASNMIISGGVNIYPAEVEQVLITHPVVADVVVFGVADAEWGENVKALIELKSGAQGSEVLVDEIKQFAAEKIAKYKLPKIIDFIDSLPRNAAGKVRIKDLK